MKGSITIELSDNGGFVIRSGNQIPSTGVNISNRLKLLTATNIEEVLQIVREEITTITGG